MKVKELLLDIIKHRGDCTKVDGISYAEVCIRKCPILDKCNEALNSVARNMDDEAKDKVVYASTYEVALEEYKEKYGVEDIVEALL